MKNLDRRDFLRLTGAAIASAFCAPLLSACGSQGIGGAASLQLIGTTWYCLRVDSRDGKDYLGNPTVHYVWDYYTITFNDADFCSTRIYHDSVDGDAFTDERIQGGTPIYADDGVDWKQEDGTVTLMHTEFKIRDDNGTPTLVVGQNMIGMSDGPNVFYQSYEQAKASTGIYA